MSRPHALAVIALGFVVEGGTEAYQFAARSDLGSGAAWVYYFTLITTFLGFYLMWRGFHEWRLLHPELTAKRAGHAPTGGTRAATSLPGSLPWATFTLFGGGTLATALWNFAVGGVGSGQVPFLIVWLIGGGIVLAFGRFFLSLEKLIRPLDGPYGRVLGQGAAIWALGTSVVAGLVMGELSLRLLVEFFSNWTALIASFAPIVIAISPLFISYGLLTIAYLDAARRTAPTVAAPADDGGISGDRGSDGATP